MSIPDFRPSAELYPFESRWLESSYGRIHYVDEGSGRPLMLLHGNPTWSFLYRNVIIRLRDRFRCVAVVTPDSGLSERPSGFQYTPGQHVKVVSQLVRRLDLSSLDPQLPSNGRLRKPRLQIVFEQHEGIPSVDRPAPPTRSRQAPKEEAQTSGLTPDTQVCNFTRRFCAI